MLTHDEAKKFYDRFGSKQDWQWFYESRAMDDLIAHGAFHEARAVFEFGCGTGHLAEILLDHYLPLDAIYTGVDISSTMVSLSLKRLSRFGNRVRIIQSQGERQLPVETGGYDRFISTYVFDLLEDQEIISVITEAHRILQPNGLAGLISLTRGFTLGSSLVEGLWSAIYSLAPSVVGGCRPVTLLDFFGPPAWVVRHRTRFSAFGVPSEILVAERDAGESS
jgi:SAM-dependent methyltransferase